MLLHWGAKHLENLLPAHLQARIKEPRVDPHHEMTEPIPYVNGQTGEVVGTVYTEGITRVSRKKLRHFLSDGEDLDIRYNKRLQRLAFDGPGETVTAYFEDGTQDTGNFVIGCDGSRSKVREYIVGVDEAKQQDLGITMINIPSAHYTVQQALKNRDLHPVVKLSFHPELPGTTLLAALDTASPDPLDWKFQNYTSWWGPPSAQDLRDPHARLDFYRNHMSKFCEPFRSAALNGTATGVPDASVAADSANGVSDEIVLPIYAGQQWSPLTPSTWDNHHGRLTLAGDAAHSMLPDRGQGLNNALADADYIVSALKTAVLDKTCSLQKAVSAYEDELRPRGGKEVELSLEQALRSKDVRSMAKDAPIFRVGHARQ
ncbi:hypothetical protein KJ359_002778 [Pestalotiopsis sp. 9143b]|nr:hypothetical protein KJ359_002778 [Pestalotiopsis sp. 9143b]